MIYTAYEIVIAEDLETLTKLVEDKIKKGWNPTGGITVLANGFAQAIVFPERSPFLVRLWTRPPLIQNDPCFPSY